MSVQTDGGLNEDDRAYVLEKVRGALLRFGASNYGELAGLLKDAVDRIVLVSARTTSASCCSNRNGNEKKYYDGVTQIVPILRTFCMYFSVGVSVHCTETVDSNL
jgi:hypothetical protein